MRFYCCSGAMIDDLTDGKIAVAFNVLGRDATRIEGKVRLEITLLSDFRTPMIRGAMVSRATTKGEAAQAFVEYLFDLQTETDAAVLLLLLNKRWGVTPTIVQLRWSLR